MAQGQEREVVGLLTSNVVEANQSWQKLARSWQAWAPGRHGLLANVHVYDCALHQLLHRVCDNVLLADC